MDTFKLSPCITLPLLYSLFASTCCALAVEAVVPPTGARRLPSTASPSASPSSQPMSSTVLIVYSVCGAVLAAVALLILYCCCVLARPVPAQRILQQRSTAQRMHPGEVGSHVDLDKPLPWVARPTANGPLREPDNVSGTNRHPTPFFPALAIPGGNPHSGVVSIDDYSQSAALRSAVAVAVSHDPFLAAAEAQSSVTPAGAPHAESTITEAQLPHHLSSDSAAAVMTSAEGPSPSSTTLASQYLGAPHPTPSAPVELGAASARPGLTATSNDVVPSHFSDDGSKACSDSETGYSATGADFSSPRPDAAADPAAADPTVAMGDIGTGLGSIPSGRARSSGGRREQKRQQDIYGKL